MFTCAGGHAWTAGVPMPVNQHMYFYLLKPVYMLCINAHTDRNRVVGITRWEEFMQMHANTDTEVIDGKVRLDSDPSQGTADNTSASGQPDHQVCILAMC